MMHRSRRALPVCRRSLSVFVLLLLASPPAPARTWEPAYALVDARIVSGTGDIVDKGTLVLRDGRIAALGAAVEPPADAIVIEAQGWCLYPGFIDAHTELGMPEVEAPSGSFSELAQAVAARRAKGAPPPGLRPDLTAHRQYRPGQERLGDYHRAGVTAAVVAPHTLILGGRSAVLSLAGSRVEDLLLRQEWAQHIAFERLRGEYPSTLMGVMATLRQWFLDAGHQALSWQRYRDAPRDFERPELDVRLAALLPAVAREQPVVFTAWTENEILRALRLAGELDLDALVSGGVEAWRVADRLAASARPLLLSLDLRPRDDAAGFGGAAAGPAASPEGERVREARANAARLHEAGVELVFTSYGLDDPAEWLDGLRQAVAEGLPEEVALASLTRRPAELLGLAATHGTLEVGKGAHVVAMTGDLFDDEAEVAAVWVDGRLYAVDESADAAPAKREEEPDDLGGKEGTRLAMARLAPRGPLGGEAPVRALRHATVLTAAGGRLENGTILMRDGKIAALGVDDEIDLPPSAHVVDATGLFVVPGIVDAHSHMAISGGGNEGSESVTPEVRIDDVIDHRDPSLFRALAGGVTTINVLHGSANVIGGQNAVLKLRWGKPAQELLFAGAPRGVKFALGENPKRSRAPRAPGVASRYPGTRLGVEYQLRRWFTAARQYRRAWRSYAELQGRTAAAQLLPPRRDLRLETLAAILEGEIRVHAHCYRSDEIAMLLRLAEDFGFRIASLQHVLEGYKVADEIAAHGAGASTFADNWAYKFEAYDAIPYNMALMTERGVRVSINSDSAERVRRLYVEAAKAVKYGGVAEEEALRMITLHPAWQLGIDERVGSIEVGKDADLAVFSHHPFTAEARVLHTFVDGQLYFDRDATLRTRQALDEIGAALEEEERRTEVEAPGTSEKAETPQGGNTNRPLGERYAAWSPPPPAATTPVALELPSTYGDRDRPSLPTEEGVVAIVGGTVYPAAGERLDAATVLLRRGRIAAVGADVAVPAGARRIDARGLFVRPGLINAGTSLGLGEINAVAATIDRGEIDDVNSNVKASVALHPHSAMLPVTRVNGITSALTTPDGGLVDGQAAFIDLDGWTPEELTARSPVAMQITFPETRDRGASGPRATAPSEDQVEERRAALERFFRHARAYAGALASGRIEPQEQEIDLKLQSLLSAVRGEIPVILDASTEEGIRTAIAFAQKLGLRAILAGSRDYWRVVYEIAQAGMPVLLGPIESSPARDAPYDSVFATAALLHDKGVPFAFRTGDAANARNLPYHAGLAVAHGLPRSAAWEALTLGAARILGVDDLYGSLEVGKVANVVVADGDLLDVPTQVRHLFIRGQEIPLTSRHTELWETFRARPAPKTGAASPRLSANGDDG